MKKILQILLFIYIGFKGHAQIININNPADAESSFSLEQLIKDVLIANTCSTVDTFTFQVNRDSTDTTAKNYGFFKTPTGSNFPFSKGIILTTGRAFPAGNTAVPPNEQVSFNNGQLGDNDLEAALGLIGTSDAVFIKFNFVPLSADFGFKFLMASEEYDLEKQYECKYADSFAFLLRKVGDANFINLAVLPDDDGTPISVTNINNSINCPANTDFFEGYNLGATSYGGRTVVLTASATVIPNETYEIKLVIADQGSDSDYDSAIFLEAGSFNFGGDLGIDRIIANGNPGCSGIPLTLDATIPIQGTNYKWFKGGDEIIGETDATLSVTSSDTYKVEINVDGGCNVEDEVVIEFTLFPIIASQPIDLLECETDTNLQEDFDFLGNTDLVLGVQSPSNFPITYHANQNDAEQNENPLILPYTNTDQSEIIWLRIADATQTCFEVTSFNIEVQTAAIANTANTISKCDDDTDGVVSFILTNRDDQIRGSQSAAQFTVNYYDSQINANSRTNALASPYTNTTSPNLQTIYARIENNNNTACFATTIFNLVVNPRPVVAAIVELQQYDDNIDGFTNFNLMDANSLISNDAANETFTYYENEVDAIAGNANTIVNFINYTNLTILNSAVYARVETNNGCYRSARINLVVSVIDDILENFKLTYTVCDDKLVDNDNSNGIAAFNFSNATNQVKALFPTEGQNLTVTYYTNQVDALAETNAIPDISNHRNTTSANTQEIYVRVDSNVINKYLALGNHITLTVNPLPAANTISDYVLCSNNDEAVFNLPTKDNDVKGAQTELFLISYHLNEQDAINNIPISTVYTNISNPQTIYVRVQFDKNGNGLGDVGEYFRTDITINLVVNRNPVIFSLAPIRICSNQVETLYNLEDREDEITGGDSTINLTYFESQADLDNNNPIADPSAYTNTLLDKNILVLATGTNLCTVIVSLALKTILYANLNVSPSSIEKCEVDNDDSYFFNLTRREDEILNGLNASDFTFTYYENETDAIAGNTNTIDNISNFENTQAVTQTIYVRVLPLANECFIVIPLILVVNPLLEIAIKDKYVICLDRNNVVIDPVTVPFLFTPPIDTQLNVAEFTFQWYNGTEAEVNTNPNSVIIVGATAPTFSPIVAGNYTVVATSIATGCTIPASTEVFDSYPPESILVELIIDVFSSNNTLEVSVTGIGNYEFRLDFGPWQASPSFQNVRGGKYVIYVRDLLNCNIISEIEVVIDYPRFFTPNNDGYHDTWNIKGIDTQADAEIYIFDRSGKLLKQLSPTGKGWNGTYNGRILPSNDYWFVIEYNEPSDGVRKKIRAHFALKK